MILPMYTNRENIMTSYYKSGQQTEKIQLRPSGKKIVMTEYLSLCDKWLNVYQNKGVFGVYFFNKSWIIHRIRIQNEKLQISWNPEFQISIACNHLTIQWNFPDIVACSEPNDPIAVM